MLIDEWSIVADYEADCRGYSWHTQQPYLRRNSSADRGNQWPAESEWERESERGGKGCIKRRQVEKGRQKEKDEDRERERQTDRQTKTERSTCREKKHNTYMQRWLLASHWPIKDKKETLTYRQYSANLHQSIRSITYLDGLLKNITIRTKISSPRLYLNRMWTCWQK